jgi:hypothetical protein
MDMMYLTWDHVERLFVVSVGGQLMDMMYLTLDHVERPFVCVCWRTVDGHDVFDMGSRRKTFLCLLEDS